MNLSEEDVPSSTVTSESKVTVVPKIVPRRITTSKEFASVTRKTYDVPPIR
jgi:hypothetical protein